MKFEYFINKNNKWIKVNYEEYATFQGEKEKCPEDLQLYLLTLTLIQLCKESEE